MKAVLTDERFSDPAWIYERKLDGIRCLATKGDKRVDLRSRNDLSLNGRFPEIAAALEQRPRHQPRARRRGRRLRRPPDQLRPPAAARRAPDARLLLRLRHPARRRRGRHRRAAARAQGAACAARSPSTDPIRFTTHRNGDGEAFYKEACRKGWEGLIAKRADAPYTHGRSRDWLKFKCSAEQELVIGGYTAPRGSRTDLGALLLGYYDDGELRYAGKVGTGFTRETLHDLAAQARAAESATRSPFADEVRERTATWVEPELVAQVGFSEWTRDGRLRHPRFLGLRDDKAAREVVREGPSAGRAGLTQGALAAALTARAPVALSN